MSVRRRVRASAIFSASVPDFCQSVAPMVPTAPKPAPPNRSLAISADQEVQSPVSRSEHFEHTVACEEYTGKVASRAPVVASSANRTRNTLSVSSSVTGGRL